MNRDVLEYLQRGLKLDKRIKDVLMDLEVVEHSNVCSVDLSAALDGRSAKSAMSTERVAIKAAELWSDYDEMLLEWTKVQKEYIDLINEILKEDANAALYICYAYVSGYNRQQIADKMSLSARQVQRIHSKAISIAERILSLRTQDPFTGDTGNT